MKLLEKLSFFSWLGIVCGSFGLIASAAMLFNKKGKTTPVMSAVTMVAEGSSKLEGKTLDNIKYLSDKVAEATNASDDKY
jgi:hypothetical protein